MSSDQPALTGLSGRIFERALIRLHRLHQDLTELRYAYRDRDDLPGLKVLVEAMLVLASEAERTVVQRGRALWEDLQQEGANAAEAHEAFRDRVGGLMNSIESAIPSPFQVAQQPHGREIEALVGPLARETARMVNHDGPSARELIFEPAADYGFQLSLLDELTPLAKNFSAALRTVLDGLPQLTVIAYPSQLEAETLLHAVLAHEIAHIALHRRGPLGEPPRAQDAFDVARREHRDTLRERLVEGAEEKEPDEEEIDRQVRTVLRRLRKWFEELACDALAVRLVGPAYVFALVGLDVASNRWKQLGAMAGEESHPGLAWRLRRLIPLARAYTDQGMDGPAWTALREALDSLQRDIPDEHDELTDIERELIEAAVGQLDTAALIEILDPAGYDIGVLANDLDVVWDKLEHDIPPAERIAARNHPDDSSPPSPDTVSLEDWSEPIDWRSIFNGCWAWWLAGRPVEGVGDGTHRLAPIDPAVRDQWIAFNAFVRGTIELGDLHERLQSVRDRLDGLNRPESD